VGALVLGAAGYLLLGGGDETSTTMTPVVHRPRAVGAAAAVARTVTAPAKKLPVAYQEQLGRDPFRALYVVPAVNSAPVSTSAVGGVLPGAGTGVPAGVGATGTGTAPTVAANKEYKLLLGRVYGTGKDRTAVFSIDGKSQVAKIGSKFGPTSEILLISLQQGPKAGQWTSVLQVGDGEPFDVVTAVPAYVR
jgi:hypothetical protein